ncbi:MAG: hypothetical protein KC503_37680 [Myxococcales bacterium]|nr:hypothetical protein [Myxococcales bacterium]
MRDTKVGRGDAYLLRLLFHTDIKPLRALLPQVHIDCDAIDVAFVHSGRIVREGWIRADGRIDFAQGWAPDTLDVQSLVATWGDVAALHLPANQHVAVDSLARAVWGYRLPDFELATIEREVLGAEGRRLPTRGLKVCCAMFALLAQAVAHPEILSDTDVLHLGLLAHDRGGVELASRCLDIISTRPEGDQLRARVGVDDTDDAKYARCRRLIAARARSQLQVPREVEGLLRLRQRPLNDLLGIKRRDTDAWGLPARMTEGRIEAALDVECGISLELLDRVFHLFVADTEGREALHDTYFRNFLSAEPRDLLQKQRWRATGHRRFGQREFEPCDLWHLAMHVLQRGRWYGYVVDTEHYVTRYEADADDRELLAFFGREPPEYERISTERRTRVLHIDLDNHGNEPVELQARYCLITERLPGAIIYRSSSNGGLHLWYFLPRTVATSQLAARVEQLLGDVDLNQRGIEVRPSPHLAGNVRLPFGLDSLPLDRDLKPIARPLSSSMRRFLEQAAQQHESLAYLLQPAESRPLVEPPQCETRPYEPQISRVVEVAELPEFLRQQPVPELIRPHERTWDSRHRIAGRAKFAARQFGVNDLPKAQAALAYWLMADSNCQRSTKLSAGEGTAANRVLDLQVALAFVWGLPDKLKLAAPQQSPLPYAGLDEVELDEADLDAVDQLVEDFDCTRPRALMKNLRRGQVLRLKCALDDLVRIIRAAQHSDQDVVTLRRSFWVERAGLHKTRVRKGRLCQLYYPVVVEFLVSRGVLEPIPAAAGEPNRYRFRWPPNRTT